MELPFVVGDATRHLLLQSAGRKNLNTYLYSSPCVKRQMLDKQVIGHKRILAELDFDSDTALYVIRLIV